MRSASLLCVGLLLLSGCGSNDDEPSSEPTATGSPASGCMSFAPGSLTTVATADLDGDGTPDEVRRVEDGACHLVVGRNGTTPLETTRLNLAEDATFRVVTLPGVKRQLLLVEGNLLGEGDGVLGPVTFHGKPLLPAASGGSPATARCNAAGGIDVVTTESSEDAAGLARRYDVTVTSYTLDGNIASAAANKVEPNVPEDELRTTQPDLFDVTAMLGTCVTG